MPASEPGHRNQRRLRHDVRTGQSPWGHPPARPDAALHRDGVHGGTLGECPQGDCPHPQRSPSPAPEHTCTSRHDAGGALRRTMNRGRAAGCGGAATKTSKAQLTPNRHDASRHGCRRRSPMPRQRPHKAVRNQRRNIPAQAGTMPAAQCDARSTGVEPQDAAAPHKPRRKHSQQPTVLTPAGRKPAPQPSPTNQPAHRSRDRANGDSRRPYGRLRPYGTW
jgi:hypothetical protein